jgi:Xaa-Pro aminopeptidase
MNIATSPAVGRVADLRNVMAQHGIDAVVVPSSDPHISEYMPDRWQGRKWLSGFTGSVGTLIVTADFAGLWVDSRYWVQAETQLAGTGIAMMKIPVVTSVAHLDWLAANIRKGGVVAADGQVMGLAAANALRAALAPNGVTLRTDLDVLNDVWRDRPGLPTAPITEHLAPHAIATRAERLALVREAMKKAGATFHVVSTLDDLAWIFNLRGSDVEYNPVFVAHALIGLNDVTLFMAPGKVDAALTARLAADGVKLADYAGAAAALARLEGEKVLIDPARVTLAMVDALPTSATRIEAPNPSMLAKSRKSAGEAANIRKTMELDGAALCEFFAWLEEAVAKNEAITELTIDDKITAARARRPGFVGPSFSTIAGFNGNGAMPHYRATPESHSAITGEGMLLIDSGGQYLGGTTDITRVVPIRASTAEQRRDYTLVLKGMIQLSLAIFPRGVKSALLDTLARAPIWAAQADYGHGTGHGVGYFLNVHEGPQSISPHAVSPLAVMEPGMITSNEPGLYRQGKWGVRIENLVMNVPAGTSEFGEFLQFETLTLCPINTELIEKSMLDEGEKAWLNHYHQTVRERLSPLVEGAAKAWLEKSTQAI